MSNYNSLKATINANIKTNGNEEITGSVLNSVLNAMVNTLGAGYQYAGVATPSTNPGSPDSKVFYLASIAGTYPNFGDVIIRDGEVAILKWDTSWMKVDTSVASLANVGSTLIFDKLYGVFSNGNLSRGVFNPNVKYRVATDTVMYYDYDVVLTPGSAYKFGLHTFVNGVFNSDSGWITQPHTITKGTHFKIVIAKRSENTQIVADVDEFVSAISVTNIHDQILQIQNDVLSLRESLETLSDVSDRVSFVEESLYRTNGELNQELFQGNIASNGGLQPGILSRVTNKNLIHVTSPLLVKCTGDVSINLIHRYANNALDNNYITETPSSPQETTILVNDNYPYVNVTFQRYSNSSQNIGIDEVGENVVFSFGGAIADLKNTIEELSRDVNRVSGGDVSVVFTQGGYSNGVPNAVASRTRFDRMLLKSELPIKITIPETTNCRLYGYNLYGTENDYSSFISYHVIPASNFKEMMITPEILGDAVGITLIFANAENISNPLTPEMMSGMEVVYVPDIELRVSAIEEELSSGNAEYYGDMVVLPVTSRKQKLTSEVVVTHTPSGYSHTKYNQSMAIHGGKAFCFNDTSFNDGFCVVIDLQTKSVVSFVQEIPTVLAVSHVNNACFTDVYYQDGDTFPLILISRGDYPNGTDKGKEMYVFRVGDDFSFTLIKTIKTEHYFFGASWEYDANRKMIWGHLCEHGDWRWGNSAYRNFNGQGLYFMPDAGTQYICIVSNEQASQDVDVTIRFTGASAVTKTINVLTGNLINPSDTVIPYTENAGGYAYIAVSQSVEGFVGQYTVCSCDADGNNRIPINYECVISGFRILDLGVPGTITIPDSSLTPIDKMDSGVFQGGCCHGGKLFLPFRSYSTINGETPSYNGHCCLVVNPDSAVIESLIPSDTLENEGCAIYDGALYISSHNPNAADSGVSFKITKYLFT